MADLLSNLTAILETTPKRWFDLVQTFPDEMLRQQPLPAEWSALECLLHMWDMERLFSGRVRAILAGQDFPAYSPDDDGPRLTAETSPLDLAQRFAAVRAESLPLLKSITPADLSKSAIHAELGRVTLSNLLHEWGGHDLMHLVQAEQAMMQPFIAGCGAWQIYFTQHVAKKSAE